MGTRNGADWSLIRENLSLQDAATLQSYKSATCSTQQVGDRGPCNRCESPTTKKCTNCKAIFYCSERCRHFEHHSHHGLCTPNYDAQPKPPHNMSRVIVLSANQAVPYWAWMENLDDLKQFLGDSMQGEFDIGKMPRSKNGYGPHLTMVHRDRFTTDGSIRNMCIRHITRRMALYPWRGPIVVAALQGYETGGCNVDMEDVKGLVHYLQRYPHEESTSTISSKLPHIQAIRVACRGEMEETGILPYTTAELEANHRLANMDLCPISKEVGEALLLARLPSNPEWNCSNAAGFLTLDIDPTSAGFGWVSEKYDRAFGSAVVIRRDHGPLQPMDVELMVHFCMSHIGGLFQELFGNTGVTTKDRILAEITPESYKECSAQYQGKSVVEELS